MRRPEQVIATHLTDKVWGMTEKGLETSSRQVPNLDGRKGPILALQRLRHLGVIHDVLLAELASTEDRECSNFKSILLVADFSCF